ncbi:MAG TPA: hypothetical protein RMH99_14700 [Sandaracinaceae bacterium LLY-WYZ-13_1]|nr:hypothetical protein [Sandaracinaceae bacterium LLY-WYZ-13_1]
MSDDELSPYERHLLGALDDALNRLASEELVEIVPEHRAALLAELLGAAANAETPRRMIKKTVRTLVSSEHVEEIYATDDQLRDILTAAIGG